MMRIVLFLSFFLWCQLLMAQKTYDGYQAFKDVREGYLVVRLPGYEKKLQVIDSLLDAPGLSTRSANILHRERERTINDRELIQHWYPIVFDSAYTFSKTAFIHNQETSAFQRGLLPARTASGEGIQGVAEGPYVFVTLQGLFGDPFTFTSRDHLVVGYPMPEEVEVPGILAFTTLFKSMPGWIKAEERASDIYAMHIHVTRLTRKLEKIYFRRVAGHLPQETHHGN